MTSLVPTIVKKLKKRFYIYSGTAYAQRCWGSLIPNKKRGTSVFEETMLAKAELPPHFGLEIVMLGCWSIWIQRNGIVFRNIQPTLHNWRFTLREELQLLQIKIKSKYSAELQHWITHSTF